MKFFSKKVDTDAALEKFSVGLMEHPCPISATTVVMKRQKTRHLATLRES